MKFLLSFFATLTIFLLAGSGAPVHAYTCDSDIAASISLSPDPEDKKPFIGTPFYLNVSGLKPNQSYSIGIRDDGSPPPDAIGFRFSDNVVDQYNANNNGGTSGPYHNGQSTSDNQTTLTFGPFDPNNLAKAVVPNRNYYITLYEKGSGLSASHYMPCPNTLVKQFQPGTSSTPGINGAQGNASLNISHCTLQGREIIGIQTALGCFPTEPGALASALFGLALGIAGAIAVLFIVLGGFKVATSQGNPDNLQAGKDQITQAIMGLVFILLATSILAIIGIDILNLSAFSRNGSGITINH